jgi:O-acetyl-ADP-ribose deacetylase (regulator of RNase III)
MEARVGKAVIELLQGDITEQDTDAIVNAANRTLLGGGGVDGAIHRAAGPQLLGPIFHSAGKKAPELLASCYRRSLAVASANRLQSVAFPSISTGAYGYPLEEAAPIALKTVMNYLKSHPDIQRVRFILFGKDAYQAYEVALRDVLTKET